MCCKQCNGSPDDHSNEADKPRSAYNALEVAQRLGLSERFVRSLIKDGAIRSVLIGRRRIIPKEAVEELLAGGELS